MPSMNTIGFSLSGKHAECRRQFIHLSRAWYGATRLHRDHDYVDEITIGMYYPGGGTTGEFTIRWIRMSHKNVPLLCVYNDAWDALWEFRDVLAELTGFDGRNVSPEEICELLLRCGIEDKTPVESPYDFER